MAKTETIGLAKALTIGLGYQTTVGAMMNTTVGAFQTEQVGGYKATVVAGGDNSIDVLTGSHKVDAAKNILLEAGDSITLRVGQSVLVMKKDGTVTLDGKDISLTASADVNQKAGGTIKNVASNIHNN